MNAKTVLELLKQTYTEWNEDKAPRLGAALSYYTVFSLAPLLVILISIAGAVFGEEAAQGAISDQISQVVGNQAAEFIETMVENARKPRDSMVASAIGLVTLLLGSMGVFGQLQDALNTIWEVKPKPGRTFLETIKARLTPFTMIIGVSFLLLSSLVVSAGISALGNWMSDILPVPEYVMHAISFVIGFVIITAMFALIFKVLPDAEIQWRDVGIGAAITTLLFMIGQLGLGLYLGKAATDSTYGAAGSLVAVLLWVYWTSQILFFGAEFTQVYANRFGSRILPSPNAVRVTEAERAQQGLGPGSGATATTRPSATREPSTDPIASPGQATNQGKAVRRSGSPNEIVEDVGVILAGVGIVLIFKRLFAGKEKSS